MKTEKITRMEQDSPAVFGELLREIRVPLAPAVK
jgi:hypothetical protein